MEANISEILDAEQGPGSRERSLVLVWERKKGLGGSVMVSEVQIE